MTKCIEDRLENELSSGPKVRIPPQVTNVTAFVQSNLCGVNVRWGAPPQTEENLVIGYEIQVRSLNGNYETYRHCMNTNSTQMLCVLQLKYLTAEPFSLLIGEPIIVRV